MSRARKTVALQLEAYEKLKAAKLPGESFAEVVRRADFPDAAPTGKQLLAWFTQGGSGVSEDFITLVSMADSRDEPPDNLWVLNRSIG